MENNQIIKRFKDIDEEEHDSSGEFAELFKESIKRHQDGEIVTGVVARITPEFVFVDVGSKSEGAIPIDEFRDASGQLTVSEGDQVSVVYQRGDRLSRRKAEMLQAWNRIEEAGGEGGVIEGTVTAKVKGGLSVDIGLPAFLPASQVDLRPGGNLDRYIGQTYQFRILKMNRKRGNVVLSRRVLLEEERDRLKGETLSRLTEGAIVEGVVKNITDYGAFVDLGGVDGLLHVTDMSWGRVSHPSEVVKTGDTLTVKILKFDQEKGKISLGLKQCLPDPWLSVPETFSVGDRVVGKVVSLTDYGAFIALKDGVEGLVHVSEMSWTKRVRHPSDIVRVGDEVEAVVLGIDMENRRISLGLKQVQPNPWTIIAERYPVGTKIEGEIKNITEFGIFIGVEEGIDGLVHVSDISWTKRIKHPGEIFTKGQTVQAVVLNIDPQNERVSLGIKQLTPDPWSDLPKRYPIGCKVHGKVSSITDFGIFLEIEEGIEGLVHISEVSTEKIPTLKDYAKPGDELDAVVLSIDTVDRKIGLSIKALSTALEKADLEDFIGSQKEATSNLGELLVQARQSGDN